MRSALQRVKRCRRGAAASAAAAEQFREAISQLLSEIDVWQGSDPAMGEAIKSELVAVGEQLAALADRPSGLEAPTATALLSAAFEILCCTTIRARELALSPGQALRLASTCRLFFTAGRTLLAGQRALVESAAPVRDSAALQQAWASSACQQLAGMCVVLLHLPQTAGSIRTAAPQQLGGRTVVMFNLPRPSIDAHTRAAAAAFEGTTVRPPALLGWLAEVTAALAWPDPVGSEASEERRLNSFHGTANYAALVSHVLTSAPYQEHAAAVAQNPPLQQAVAGLLLGRCLPAMAHHLLESGLGDQGAAYVQQLSAALSSNSLRAAVAGELRRPGAAAAAVRHAASLAAALPATRPDGWAAPFFAYTHGSAMLLLSHVCELLLPQPPAAGSNDNTGITTSGSSSAAAGSATAGSAAAAVAAGSEEWRGAATALLELLPLSAAVVEALVADPGCPPQLLATLCHNMALPFDVTLLTLGRLADAPWGPQQLQAWAVAAEAAMRLQPLLAQLLDRQWQDEQDEIAVCQLSGVLLFVFWAGVTDTQGAAHAPSVGRSLWQVHGAACRLLHWLAADSGTRQLAVCVGPPGAGTWLWLLSGLHQLYMCAEPFFSTPPHQESAEEQAARLRDAGALAAAHWATTQVCLSAAAGASARASTQPCLSARPGPTIARLLGETVTTLKVATACPGLVGPQLLRMLLNCQSDLAQLAHDGSREFQGAAAQLCVAALQHTAIAAAQQPRLAAGIVAATCSGMHGTGSSQPANAAWQCIAASGLAAQLLPFCCQAVAALAEAGVTASSSLRAVSRGGGGSTPLAPGGTGESQQQQRSELAAQLEAAAERLKQLLSREAPLPAAATEQGSHRQQGSSSSSGSNDSSGSGEAASAPQEGSASASATQQLERLHRLLAEPAAELAALLKAYWQLPEQHASAALELAQAATARSCAYLRCANVALEGGPGVGEGHGCKRCGGCRVARYCSTACSHADWRGSAGHKRVCAQLAGAAAEAATAPEGSSDS